KPSPRSAILRTLMPFFARIASLCRNLFVRHRAELDLDEELHSYLDLLAQEKVESGLTVEQARRQARLELGGSEQVKERVRDRRIVAGLDPPRQDLRYAVRSLRNIPGFAATAILTFALGTGVNAAAFGLVESAFFRALPFAEPERLVQIGTTDAAGDPHTPSTTEFIAVRNYAKSFEQVTGLGWSNYYYENDGPSSQRTLPGLLIT